MALKPEDLVSLLSFWVEGMVIGGKLIAFPYIVGAVIAMAFRIINRS